MALFGKHKPQAAPSFQRDLRKARRFFEHAQTVADARNYDYAIECYVNGLRHQPDNLAMHQALRETALKRKVAGGKPVGWGEKLGDLFKKGSKNPVDRMLDAEMLWSKDPLNPALAVEVMARAVESGEADGELKMSDVAYWVGTQVLDPKQSSQKPGKSIYVKARDLFGKIRAFAKAVEACQRALQLDPGDPELLDSLKNLEAERTMQEGGYAAAGGQEGGFRKMVRDLAQQRALEQEEGVAKASSALDQTIERRRAEYQALRDDVDRAQKLVAALLQKETAEADEESIQLLRELWEKTGQYRFKVRMGDVRIRQFQRQGRNLRAAAKADPENRALRKQLQELAARQLQFELEEYTERVQNYPTDLGLRFELGKRLFAVGKYDEAIASFQQAKGDPRYRAASHEFLGRSYAVRGWLEEAIEALRQGIESHPSKEDRLGLSLRYQLMTVLKQSAIKSRSLDQAKEAQKIASQVLQTDINFADIRQQVEEVRKLVDELEKSRA